MTPDQLMHVYGCSAQRATTYCDSINAAMDRFEINTPARICGFIAQAGHESARLLYVEEIDSGVAYNNRADLGNRSPEALQWSQGNPGPYFKGHGLIQITGYDNHRDCGIDLYPDDPEIFLRNPRALCLPGDAAMSAAWFWKKHGCNEAADAGNFALETKIINGGFNGEQDRESIWAKAKEVLA